MTDLTLRFDTAADVSAESVVLRGLEGREAMSTPYAYTLTLEVEADNGWSEDVIAQLLTQPAHATIAHGELCDHEIHGVLRRITLEPMIEPSRAVYRAELVPSFSRLELAYGSRIFQDLSGPAVAMKVLEEHGITYESRLTETYPEREYIVQYEESDLAFVQRLLEHWGVAYFFEQLPDGEKMVLVDSASASVALEGWETVAYALREAGTRGQAGTIHDLSRTHEIRPAKVDLKDWNWRHPQVVPEGEAPADEATGYGTVHAYGEHIKDPSEGAWMARVRAEERMAGAQRYAGGTDLPGLSPGHKLLLSGYPSGDLDLEYLVVGITQRFPGEDGGYEKRFDAIPLAVPFRPARVTPKPKIAGFMHAVVDGEVDGAAAPIDEHGRYRLLLPFDRLAEPGGRASRWVRMTQASSGPDYGMHLPLHIGCEVALIHVDGDPDRPVILGAVPNADTMSPVTQTEATKSRIRTRSGILIEMEDASR